MKHLIPLLLLSLSFSAVANSKLGETIPYPFHDVQENQGNKVMVIDSGVAALELRLQMIRRAQKNIEAEYFIYNTDVAAKIFTRELVEAAKRGVKVRILIDKNLATFKFNAYYAEELAPFGIEVKYYNNAPVIAISTVQFRNHRKLLSIDDTEAITGGRNIGDDYFDISHEFNFYDRDIYAAGPIVKVMRESFDQFFDHKISVKLKRPERSQNNEDRASRWDAKVAKAKSFLEESPEETLIRSRLADVGVKTLETYKMHDCPTATYSTDAPGANFRQRLKEKYLDKFRFLRQTLAEKTLEVNKAFTLSSPYMIHNGRTRKVMKHLLENKVDINVYTNSLASTDAVYVAANLYLYIKAWARAGIKIFLHDGKFLNDLPAMTAEAEKARWGTHDKSQVYESTTHSEVMIGTYNIDNRSNFYNTEMALFCRGNDELSQEVKDSIMRRAKKGIQIQADGSGINSEGMPLNIYGATRNKVIMMKLITLPSWLLNFLL
ncbi:MAG: phospholipase D family protein [Bdellovibrionota bacterium]